MLVGNDIREAKQVWYRRACALRNVCPVPAQRTTRTTRGGRGL